ncbi:MAG TPA: hypothetical protein VJT14_04845 [Candidatus Dormibacteraeota bacterium]|nr:hypothetical protein [Candidatus Dormibacteraeota bacterium]
MSDLKGVIIAAEAVVLLAISFADVVSGQFLGAAIILGIASLAAVCAWALWPREQIIGLAGAGPRRAGSSRRQRH